MVCKDCVNFAECKEANCPDHVRKMWLIEFWNNAEAQCRAFEKSEEG